MKTLLTTSALAFGLTMSAPVVAQDSTTPSTASPATSAPAPTDQPAPATGADPTGSAATGTPAAPATSADPAAGATAAQQPSAGATPGQSAGATGTAASANSSAQVSAVIEAGFPKYDADGSGDLSQAEFKQWVSDLKTQEMAASGQGLDATQAEQYASRALRVADADGNKTVTRDELTTFLGGG